MRTAEGYSMRGRSFVIPAGIRFASRANGGAGMLELLIVIVLILWLLGYFGPARIPNIPNTGGLIHLLLVIVLVLIIIRLL
jgi:hypothetical protein